MKQRHLFIIYALLTLVFLYFINISGLTADHQSFFKSISRDAALEYILNYPFSNKDDLQSIHEQLQFLPVAGRFNRDFLAEVNAFTSTRVIAGEQLLLVNFSSSNNKAVKALRNEAHLPPPKGGAILRIYAAGEIMPPPIRALFQGNIQGITRYYRFIAINAAHKSPEELENIISHELVHAYILSSLGVNNTLPRWFNEGVALYLSGAKDQYVTLEGLNWTRISRVSDEYAEYRLIFRYLNYALGRRGVTEFIRQTVQQQSVTASLPEATGLTNYQDLRNKAEQWRFEQQNRLTGIGIIIFIFIVGLGSWIIYQNQLHLKILTRNQVAQIAKTVQLYDRQITAEIKQISGANSPEALRKVYDRINRLKKKKALALIAEGRALAKLGQLSEARHLFAEALKTAPCSPQVVDSVQLARDELEGLIV